MKILNLREAFMVHNILKKYFPNGLSDNPLQDMKSFITNESLPDFLRCLSILTGKSASEIYDMGGSKSIGTFLECYKANRLQEMFSIMEKLLNGTS